MVVNGIEYFFSSTQLDTMDFSKIYLELSLFIVSLLYMQFYVIFFLSLNGNTRYRIGFILLLILKYSFIHLIKGPQSNL